MIQFISSAFMFILLAIPGIVHAACDNPPGEAGVQIFNSTHSVMQYCDGDKWIGMGGCGGDTPDLDAVLTKGNAAGGKQITGLAAPTANDHAATKAYADGKFGTLTNNQWCRTNGTRVICDQAAPVTAEVDPKVRDVTNNKWCRGTGTQIACDQDAPAGDGDTLAALGCEPGESVGMGVSAWECIAPGAGGSSPDFYVTSGTFLGAVADTACAAGYHMCVGTEFYGRALNKAQGVAITGTGSWIDSIPSNDCTGWTSSSGSSSGAWLKLENGQPTIEYGTLNTRCNVARPVICCQD
jgi:hypothetical protein